MRTLVVVIGSLGLVFGGGLLAWGLILAIAPESAEAAAVGLAMLVPGAVIGLLGTIAVALGAMIPGPKPPKRKRTRRPKRLSPRERIRLARPEADQVDQGEIRVQPTYTRRKGG